MTKHELLEKNIGVTFTTISGEQMITKVHYIPKQQIKLAVIPTDELELLDEYRELKYKLEEAI